jgi:type II secretory pathway pseudopilin PulG
MKLSFPITSRSSAFTLVEIMMVVGILTLMLSIGIGALTSIQTKTYLDSTINTFIADFKQQQIKSMLGDTEGRATSDSYGIYVEPTRYTLFHGTTYSSSDPTNFRVNFESTIRSSITIQLVFSRGSGDIANYSSSNNTIVLQDTGTNTQKTITFNRYGAIVSVN